MLDKIFLYLRSWFIPMQATLDGIDNSVSINKSLYNALLRAGIAQPGANRIFAFRIGEQRYGFSVNPQQISDVDTIVTQLQVNNVSKTIGFELLCPSVQRLFNDWHLSPDTVAHAKVSFHVINGLCYFEIHKPNAKEVESHVRNVYSINEA